LVYRATQAEPQAQCDSQRVEKDQPMNCRFHVGIELVAVKVHVPLFVATGNDGDQGRKKDRTRTVLKCPIACCPFVAMEYDAERTEPRLCRICRKVKVVFASGLCSICGPIYRKRHPDKRDSHHGVPLIVAFNLKQLVVYKNKEKGAHARALHAQHA
jgi:hypothetical protein